MGWDVMVDLRRTQKSKSLLVFPLFGHLGEKKKKTCGKEVSVQQSVSAHDKQNTMLQLCFFYHYVPKERRLSVSINIF